MSCLIQFTDTAKADLREIAFYIAEQSGEKDVAIRFVKELQEKCRTLADFPARGAIPRDRVLKSSGFRFLTHKDYLIFYQHSEAENTVYIMALFNGKKDYFRVMRRYI